MLLPKESESVFNEDMSRKTDKKLMKLVKHFSKYHLITDTAKDNWLYLIKAYFAVKILKNIYHANYLIIDLISKGQKENMLQKNQRYLYFKYFENLIIDQHKLTNDTIKVDLQSMLDVN